MADAPKSPPRGDKNRPAAGVQFSERSLDLDVRSSTGPYPRPRPPRSRLKKTWLAAAGAAVILGLTWVLFSSDDGSAPSAPAAVLTGSADRPEILDFAPVPDQSEDKPASPQELTETPPVQVPPAASAAPAQAQPADTPVQATPAPTQTAVPATPAKPKATPAKPKDTPAPPAQATPPAVPAQAQPATQAEPAQAMPVQATEQPASPVEKPAEISDKWVVNVSSTPDAAESLRFLSALMGQDVGGKVYASEAVLEGRVQHRIRVGFFDTREEAEAVGQKIKERFRLYATPWAVRPSKEEENKYGDGR